MTGIVLYWTDNDWTHPECTNRKFKVIIENAVQTCLQVHTLPPDTIAQAYILRARARIESGSVLGAQDDLNAALVAEPDNPEATALLHQRSVAVAKVSTFIMVSDKLLTSDVLASIPSSIQHLPCPPILSRNMA